MTMGLAVNAQDGFFNNWNDGYGDRAGSGMSDPTPLTVPMDELGSTNDTQLPLGSGLLILGALGAGYAGLRNKRK